MGQGLNIDDSVGAEQSTMFVDEPCRAAVAYRAGEVGNSAGTGRCSRLDEYNRGGQVTYEGLQ